MKGTYADARQKLLMNDADKIVLLNKNEQRWKSQFANSILELVRALVYKCKMENADLNPPILVFGNWSQARSLSRYLSKKFTTYSMDEFYTSKKCPCCHKFVKPTGTYRHWTCECYTVDKNDKKIPLQMNKDTSACFNMLYIFVHILATGERPEAFRR